MATSPHKILVLDDDPDISTMVKLMLEYKGYSVITAGRAEEMHKLLDNGGVDLIIMDMLLSGRNGIDVCAELKQAPETTAIPVLMISAHPNAQEICLEAGANDFVSKPFDMQEILSKINHLLQ